MDERSLQKSFLAKANEKTGHWSPGWSPAKLKILKNSISRCNFSGAAHRDIIGWISNILFRKRLIPSLATLTGCISPVPGQVHIGKSTRVRKFRPEPCQGNPHLWKLSSGNMILPETLSGIPQPKKAYGYLWCWLNFDFLSRFDFILIAEVVQPD